MAARPWHLLSLCDGYGGTELALRSVAQVQTVCRVERDAYAAAILVERMGQARLDPCPIWDDVATFDGRPWRGRVDIVAAGFPCPDFSSAGRRAGVDGEHWLWPECYEVIRQVGPSVVLLENVPGLVRLGGLTRVLSDLADDGFDAEWGLLAASAVGAPHERERWWLLGHRLANTGGGGCEAEHQLTGCPRSGIQRNDDRCDPAVGDTDGARRAMHPGSSSSSQSPNGGWPTNGDHVADGPVEDVDYTHCQSRRQSQRDALAGDRRPAGTPGQTQPRRCSGAPHAWPPRRDDHDGWRDWIAAGGPQPVLRRLTDGPPVGLADALHLGGNGLVPQCAAHAWGQLLERAGVQLT